MSAWVQAALRFFGTRSVLCTAGGLAASHTPAPHSAGTSTPGVTPTRGSRTLPSPPPPHTHTLPQAICFYFISPRVKDIRVKLSSARDTCGQVSSQQFSPIISIHMGPFIVPGDHLAISSPKIKHWISMPVILQIFVWFCWLSTNWNS